MSSPIVLPTPATHQEWLEQRRAGVGSSDASAILGLSQYESPFSLWQQKTGKVPLDPPVDDTTAELREWGHRLEPVIRQATAERLGLIIEKPDHAFAHPGRVWQRANLDGLVTGTVIFEAKNTHLRNTELWHDQIPDHAEIQVTHSAAVIGAQRAIVAGLIGGNRLVIHEIDINPTIVDIITEAEARFWDHVQSDTPPPVDGHVRTMQALTTEWAHRPGDREVTEADVRDWWEEWAQADAEEKAAAERKRRALAQITTLMDGHGRLVTGERVWAAAQRGQLNMKRLEADHPELVAEYTRRPAFDLEAFKKEQADIYRTYQGVSIRPKHMKEN